MKESSSDDYAALDRPEISMYLFHPRAAWGSPADNPYAQEIAIPVDEDVVIGARFYTASRGNPVILFFHGNGEIVDDYNDLAGIYLQLGINFFPVDYRGYGRSTGTPTVSAMMRDSRTVFRFVRSWMETNGYTGPLIVMGRSLGSASALELSAVEADRIDALIIESGFAHSQTLLRILGIDMTSIGITEAQGFRNIDKIRSFAKPTLVIHAENDHILPFADGRALFDACPAPDKKFLGIPNANHNDLFMVGLMEYMTAVVDLARKVHTEKPKPAP